METTDQLKALLASIEEEVPSDTTVYLHLPAVTYDGDIVFGDHVWGIYGSTEEDITTTFTGTVSMRGMNGNYADISGVHFAGNSGTGLNAFFPSASLTDGILQRLHKMGHGSMQWIVLLQII